MLSASAKRKLRHVVLAGTVASLPALYLGAVSLESAAITIAGLALAGATAVLAWLAF